MKVAVFFPKPKMGMLNGILSGELPDKLSALSKFPDHGMECTLFDPLPLPFNPLTNLHSLYSGLDPIRAIIFALKKSKYDVILCVGESSAFSLTLLKKYFGIKMPPIVIWDPALTISWKNRYKMLRYILPKVDRVAVLGENQRAFVQKHFSRNDVDVLPHWIDTDFFSPSGNSADLSSKYILAVGDDASRDYGLLEQAIEGVDVEVRIVSRKYNPVDSNKIKMIREFLSFDELKKQYENALFVVVPLTNVCHAGGINGIQEAMSMRKATIVSYSEGIQDYISDDTSLMVNCGNAEEMHSAIEKLVINPALCHELGENARHITVQKYACDILASCFRNLFNSMLDHDKN